MKVRHINFLFSLSAFLFIRCTSLKTVEVTKENARSKTGIIKTNITSKIRPNILFVYSDQWRRMAMSHYNHPRFDNTYNQGDPVITPNFDNLAAEGVVFNNAIVASPICSPNRATLMTGLYPVTHKLVDNKDYQNFTYDNQTIAEVLKQNGYDTGHIGKWHIAISKKKDVFFDSPKAKRGFGYWYGSPTSNHTHFDAKLYHHSNEIDGLGEYTKNSKGLPNPFVPSKDYKSIELRKQESWNPDHLTRKALDYLKNTFEVRDTNKPFALYVSYNPPHTIHGPKPKLGDIPSYNIQGKLKDETYYGYRDSREEDYDYVAPLKYEKQYRDGNSYDSPVKMSLRKRPNVPINHYSQYKCLPGYYGAINAIDACFGELDKYLTETPDPRYPEKTLKQTTIVVVTADHGEMMGSQNHMTKGVPFEESIGIPLIIRWPDNIPSNKEENSVFSTVDIAPSLLGLLNIKFSNSIDGKDRHNLFLGNKEIINNNYAFVGLRNWRTVRTENEIFIVENLKKQKTLKFTYFNLKDDPFEMKPLIYKSYGTMPYKIKKLYTILKTHLVSINDSGINL